MSHRRNYGRKKTPDEANRYNKILENRTAVIENTYISDSHSYLNGTEENMAMSDGTGQKPKPKKWYYAFGDWIKKNIVLAIAIPVLLAFAGYVFLGVIDSKSDIRVINFQITEIQKDIESLAADSVSKEIMEMQLSALRSSLDDKIVINSKDIELQIELIKQQIEFIKTNNNQADEKKVQN